MRVAPRFVLAIASALVFAAACRTPKGAGGGGGGSGAGSEGGGGAVGSEGQGSAGGGGGEVAAPISDDECLVLIDHTLALGLAEQRASKPAEYVPTAEQVAEIRTKLIAQRPCAELTRPQYVCALAAADQAALYACAQPPAAPPTQ